MTKPSLPFRTHYFSLAVAKHVFLHPAHGVVFVRDAIRCSEAKKYKLSPLLLYALSIPGSGIRRLTFAPLDQPQGIYATLQRLWTIEADSFRGRSDAVLVSRHVAAASTKLAGLLAEIGVELIVADKGDKVSGADLRTAQNEATNIGFLSKKNRRISDLDILDEEASYRHAHDVRYAREMDKKAKQLQDQWAVLPLLPVPEIAREAELVWSPGEWLRSWEVNLPPVSQPRFFQMDREDRKMWLFTGTNRYASDDDLDEDEDTDQEWGGVDGSIPVEEAKDLVTCWPNSVVEIANSIGTTARALRWYLDGKASLDQPVVYKLISLLGIEWRETGYTTIGPCALIAKDIDAAFNAYNHLSGGGDVGVSCEVVPDSGQADPSWRYLVFQRPFGGTINILMFERGSKAAERLHDKYFTNFEGLRKVPGKLYRDVVSTCARASLNPQANRREMLGFEQRQADALGSHSHIWEA